MFKIFYKAILNIFSKLIKKRRIACCEFGAHYELTIVSEPKIKMPISAELLSLFVKIANNISTEPYTFSRKVSQNWDNLVRNESGEHYRLLPAIIKAINAKNIIEIGTFMGASSVAIIENSQASIVTYDLLSWDSMDTYLKPIDFSNGRVRQILGDISNNEFFLTNLPNLVHADMIFVDAPKDGIFEPRFWSLVEANKRELLGKVFVFDDIRVSTMHDFWQDIDYPKIDLGSLGHWSGTGLVILI
jgi:predicted O-methyltransferase YrrM